MIHSLFVKQITEMSLNFYVSLKRIRIVFVILEFIFKCVITLEVLQIGCQSLIVFVYVGLDCHTHIVATGVSTN